MAAVAAAASVVVVPVSPAHAEIQSPAANSVVREQPTVAGEQQTDDRGDTVDRVTVTLTPAGGGESVSMLGCSGATCKGTAGAFSATFQLARNGTYTAVAVAEHDARSPLDPASSGRSAPLTFGVEVAPAAPRRLVAEADGARRTVTLSWTPNSEADLLGYQVLRGVDGAGPEPRGAPVGADTTTFVDDAGDGGRLTYQVVAIRRGATASSIVASEASNDATATIDRVAPPTTAGPATGGGGGSSGGSGGGDGGDGGASGGGGSGGGLRPQTAAAPLRITPGARLDLSGFTPNSVPLNLGPAPEPDPGFQQTLPYQLRPEATDDPVVDDAGQDDAALPVGSLTTTSETNRRALLAFLAGAMLLFMLSMHLRWLLRRTTPATG